MNYGLVRMQQAGAPSAQARQSQQVPSSVAMPTLGVRAYSQASVAPARQGVVAFSAAPANAPLQGGVMACSAAPAKTSAIATLAPLTDVCRALVMSNAGSGKPFSVMAHYQKYGYKAFVSKGILPEIAKSTVMRVSKFFFFPLICENMHGAPPKECTPLQKGLAGALATVPEIAMISPLEVAKIGMQLDSENKYKNNSRVFLQDLYKTRGLGGMYTGWAGMQWRQCFWTGTFFATLSWWKSTVEPPMTEAGVPQSLATLVSGFLAGFFATFPNAPGDVVRSVVQKRVFAEPNRTAYGISINGVVEHVQVARDIVRTSGLQGLYSGLGFKAMHLGGSGALMAVLIPKFSELMGIQYGGV